MAVGRLAPALRALLQDSEWRGMGEIVELVWHHVPPETAMRRWRRTASDLALQVTPYDEQLRKGKRLVVYGALKDMKAERYEAIDGTVYWRWPVETRGITRQISEGQRNLVERLGIAPNEEIAMHPRSDRGQPTFFEGERVSTRTVKALERRGLIEQVEETPDGVRYLRLSEQGRLAAELFLEDAADELVGSVLDEE